MLVVILIPEPEVVLLLNAAQLAYIVEDGLSGVASLKKIIFNFLFHPQIVNYCLCLITKTNFLETHSFSFLFYKIIFIYCNENGIIFRNLF